jgi:hypothetical protein
MNDITATRAHSRVATTGDQPVGRGLNSNHNRVVAVPRRGLGTNHNRVVARPTHANTDSPGPDAHRAG